MAGSDKRILVGIAVLGDMKIETTTSLIQYALKKKYLGSIACQNDSYTHSARNRLVYKAVEEKATHLMFVDADMQFDGDSIDKLADRNLDIVGGMYSTRGGTPTPVLRIYDKELNGLRGAYPDEIRYDRPFEVDAIGTGFMMIKMSVFQTLEPPFFFHEPLENWGLAKQPFPNNELGDDVAFCWKAKQAGFKIWCDPTFDLGHVGKHVFTHKDLKESAEKWDKRS